MLSGRELGKALHEAMKTLNSSPSNSFDAITAGIKEIIDEKERRIRSESKKEISFLGGHIKAFKRQIDEDIQLMAGIDDGPCIPTHRAILASHSKVFEEMLAWEKHSFNVVTLSELNTEELRTLLEFLYGGSLSHDKMEKHLLSLFLAAHKYKIRYLQECCERHILASITANDSKVLDFLVDALSSEAIKETVMKFIVENMKEIAFSEAFQAFTAKNPHLTVQIVRAHICPHWE